MKIFSRELSRSSPYRSGLIISVIATMIIFILSSVYANYRLSEIDGIVRKIELTALPSIAYLTNTNDQLSDLLTLIDKPNSKQLIIDDDVKNAISNANKNTKKYLELDVLQGENQLWQAVRDQLFNISKKMNSIESKIIKGEITPLETKREIKDIQVAVDKAKNQLFKTIQNDLLATENLSKTIVTIRKESVMTTLILSLIGILFATAILVAMIVKFRKFDNLIEAQENKIKDQVNELKQFAGRISHDLRSPLAVIVSSLQAFSITDDPPETDYIDMARRNSIRALELVEHLYDFANSGGHADRSETTYVHKVFEDVKNTFLTLAVKKNIQLIFECDPKIIIHCKGSLFFSVIENLVENAIKYMGNAEVKRIEVSALEKDNQLLISVKDTGPGIPTHLHEKIFEPFERGNNTEADGFGLGLATVRKIVVSCGGQIHLESGIGQGSCFQLSFPLDAPNLSITS